MDYSKKQEEFVLPKMAPALREDLVKGVRKSMLIIIWSFELILQDQM